MRKHFVTFFSPGTFVSESTTKEIAERDTVLAAKMAKQITERYGAKPYGFEFSTAIVADDVPDGEGGKLKVEPKTVDRSGIHFLGGTLETIDHVNKRSDPKEETLRFNMRCNDIFVVCVNTNSYKSVHPFGKQDVLLNADGVIINRGDSPKWIKYRKKCSARKAAAHA